MKLNFWQWLGVALLLLGVGVYLADKGRTSDKPTTATTQPGY